MSPRRGARPAAAAASLLVAAVLAGCGSDARPDGTRESYVRAADAACAKLDATLVSLPAVQKRRDLTVKQVQPLADRAGDEFDRTIRALAPPPSLRRSHRRLIAVLDRQRANPLRTADVPQLVARIDESRRAYAADGLDGCARIGQRQIDRIQASTSARP